MNLFFRFFWFTLISFFKPAMGPLDECSTKLRVWVNDIDIYLHMNNGRYLTIMDIGRTELIVRTGLFKKLFAHKIYPVVASEMIRFNRSIDAFQGYELKTRILGWDDKYFYLVQKFIRKESLCAQAVVKVRFLQKGVGKIPPQKVIDAYGAPVSAPALPLWVHEWQEAEQAYVKS